MLSNRIRSILFYFNKSPRARLIVSFLIILISILEALLIIFLVWVVSIKIVTAQNFSEVVTWGILFLFLFILELIIAYYSIRIAIRAISGILPINMIKTDGHLIEKIKKLIWFFVVWWVIGAVLAFFWGLGWFFLIVTLRRIVTYFPPIRRKFRVWFLGEEQDNEKEKTDPRTRFPSQLMGGIIILIWIGLTIYVFSQLNISLISILNHSSN